METNEVKDLAKENLELTDQLTKKNAQYFHDLKKSLATLSLSEEEQEQHIHEMLVQTVEAQKQGTLAKTLFGTVTDHVRTLSDDKFATGRNNGAETDKPLLMWLDSALLLLGIVAGMSGIMAIFAKNHESVYGILTILVMSGLGGAVFYLMYHFVYRYELPEFKNEEKPKFWKILLVTFAAIIAWMVFNTLAMMLPVTINAHLTFIPLILVGVLAIVLKMYLKRKYNIRSAMQRVNQYRR